MFTMLEIFSVSCMRDLKTVLGGFLKLYNCLVLGLLRLLYDNPAHLKVGSFFYSSEEKASGWPSRKGPRLEELGGVTEISLAPQGQNYEENCKFLAAIMINEFHNISKISKISQFSLPERRC